MSMFPSHLRSHQYQCLPLHQRNHQYFNVCYSKTINISMFLTICEETSMSAALPSNSAPPPIPLLEGHQYITNIPPSHHFQKQSSFYFRNHLFNTWYSGHGGVKTLSWVQLSSKYSPVKLGHWLCSNDMIQTYILPLTKNRLLLPPLNEIIRAPKHLLHVQPIKEMI